MLVVFSQQIKLQL